MAKFPDFMIPGVMRGGTSSLFAYLASHPKIVAPNTNKEIHFFDCQYDEDNAKGYISNFPMLRNSREMLYFEATPDYLFEPGTPKNIQQWIPDCRFIILLRNPVARAWSHYYNHDLGLYGIRLEDLRRMPEQVTYDMPEKTKAPYTDETKFRILQHGIYVKMLKRWFEYFPRENNLIIKSEDLFEDPHSTTKLCLEWLGIQDNFRLPRYENFDFFKMKGMVTPKPLKDIAEAFTEFYKPFNEMLYAFLDRDFGW